MFVGDVNVVGRHVATGRRVVHEDLEVQIWDVGLVSGGGEGVAQSVRAGEVLDPLLRHRVRSDLLEFLNVRNAPFPVLCREDPAAFILVENWHQDWQGLFAH